jgi:hypothetical protein
MAIGIRWSFSTGSFNTLAFGENKQVTGSYHYGQAEGICDGPAKGKESHRNRPILGINEPLI